MDRKNIKINGFKDTWYIIDESFHNGKQVYLLESEKYGEDIPSIIVDKNFNIIKLNVYNGFDDLSEE